MLTCHFGTANIFAGFWIRACWICAKYAKINVPQIFPLLQYLGPFSLQKYRDMKTRYVSHCVSSLLQKLAMLAPTKKLRSFWKNCACPVYSFNHSQRRCRYKVQYSTYSCTVYKTPIRLLARLIVGCGSHASKITIFLLCAFSLQNLAKLEKSHSDLRFFMQSFGWNLVQLLGNFHPNFASFQALWEWPLYSLPKKYSIYFNVLVWVV